MSNIIILSLLFLFLFVLFLYERSEWKKLEKRLGQVKRNVNRERLKSVKIPREPPFFATILITISIFSAGCLGFQAPPPEVIERHCALEDLRETPYIPTVEWIHKDGLHCTDDASYYNAKLGKSRCENFVKYCVEVYQGAQERCEE